MNDVVAYESFSKSDRTPRSEAIPCVSSETGALRALSPTHFPPGSAAAETLQIARTGGARVGFGFAKLRLDVERAWQTVMHLDCREALVIAELIEHDANRLPAAAAKALRCEIAALRAVAFVLQDDEAAALPAALSALGPGASARTAHVASTVCRSVYWRLGNLERFYAVERVTLDFQPGRLQPVSVPFDLALDAAVALDQMRFNAARLLAGHALEIGRRFAGTHVLADAFSACIVAQVLYEQGQLDEAEELLAARIANLRQCCTVESALRAYGLLARIAVSRGQHGRALVVLSEAEALGERRGWPRLRAASLAHQAEIEAGSGRKEQAASCLQRLAELAAKPRADSSNVSFEIRRFHTIAEAHVALARSPRSVDIASLRQVHRDMVWRGGLYAAVPVTLLLVEALLVMGQRSEAVEVLAGLLRLAPSVGLHQTLVDCSVRVAELIDAIVQQRIVPVSDTRELLPYASMLVLRRQPEAGETDEPFAARRPNVNAGLSERERLIVALMGRGLSNKEIAGELGIAPETVKSHAKHLYSKLSVKNRTEAVTLATRLGLLPMPRSLAV
jgi:ATP/maltotriose-dependent transcriptional regulator MalT